MNDMRERLADALRGCVGELGGKTIREDAEIAADIVIDALGLREETAQDSEPGSPRVRRIVTEWEKLT
jgi:hypothetical protein